MEEENIFGFESDHVALRGNRDYANLLRTICVLEVQRERVLKQLEELEIAQQRYLDDPELLLTKLRNNEPIISPNYMTIEQLPDINIEDYLSTTDVKIKKELDTNVETPKVRGRLIDATKPDTFNRLWTCEEQRRLEELLIEYPVEPIESRRYVKIAKALGNRTPQQVCSRVQKYFLKLHEAGLPIPGRIPKNRRSGQLKTKHFSRPSTFFPAYNVPVHMPESETSLSDMLSFNSQPVTPDSSAAQNSDTSSNADDVEYTTKNSNERERMLHILRMIREEKDKVTEGYHPDPLAGPCEGCGEPVSYKQWRCNTCDISLNQCSDCIVSLLMSEKFEHITHDIVAVNEFP